ncbi:MAG TPA: M55 family metallopeptidase [Spirochaetia bacterium]|nr:M55 family metallopeptidase [Spirochaetia bacterium]
MTDHPTVFVAADMEGTVGYVNWPAQPPEPADRRAQLLAEVNAAIEGAIAGGAGQIIVSDSHWSKENLEHALLGGGASLIRGGPRPYLWMTGVEKADMVFLVGFHAASGTSGAVLPHTIDRRIRSLRLNGENAGEALLSTLAAGYHGVPVGLVTGDQALVTEVQAFLPGVTGVAVKEAVMERSAVNVHPAAAGRHITNAARQAVERAGELTVLRPREPVDLDMELNEPHWQQALALVPGVRATGGCTVNYRAAWPRIMALLSLFAGWIR